jgi:hypothetical protein
VRPARLFEGDDHAPALAQAGGRTLPTALDGDARAALRARIRVAAYR